MYVNEDKAFGDGLANITYEEDVLDWYAEKAEEKKNGVLNDKDDDDATTPMESTINVNKKEQRVGSDHGSNRPTACAESSA